MLFKSKYDFALSFAGEERILAEKINDYLSENDIAVFYDKNEQHRILAENIEDYLAPIYSSEAQFVIVLLSKHYPKKLWTKFESDNFKQRFGEGSIIWYDDVDYSFFDESRNYGGLDYSSKNNIDAEVERICTQLMKRLSEERYGEIN